MLLVLINYSYGQTPKTTSIHKSAEQDSTKEDRYIIRLENKQFEALKGNLPFPVDLDSLISFDFNENSAYDLHVNYRSVPIEYTSFICKKNTPVKAIASCTVAIVTYIGDSQAIIFRIGDYFFSYSNLKTITMKKGDKVNAGEIVGIIDDLIDENSELEVSLSISTGSDKGTKYLLGSKWFNTPAQPVTPVTNKKL